MFTDLWGLLRWAYKNRHDVFPFLWRHWTIVALVLLWVLLIFWVNYEEALAAFFSHDIVAVPLLAWGIVVCAHYLWRWRQNQFRLGLETFGIVLLAVLVFLLWNQLIVEPAGYRKHYLDSSLTAFVTDLCGALIDEGAPVPELSDSPVDCEDLPLLSPQGLASSGKTLLVADWERHVVFALESSGVERPNLPGVPMLKGRRLAGDGSPGCVDSSDALRSKFHQPSDIAVDKERRFAYVADYGNGAIRRISLASKDSRGTHEVCTVMTCGDPYLPACGFTRADRTSGSPGTLSPTSASPATSFGLCRCDDLLPVEIDPPIFEVASGTTGIEDSSAEADADGPSAEGRCALENPTGISLDPNGNIYVADESTNTISRIDLIPGEGGMYTPRYRILLGDRMQGWTSSDVLLPKLAVPASQVRFQLPSDVYVPEAGVMFIADNWNNAIRKVTFSETATGAIHFEGIGRFAGTGQKGFKDGDADSEAMFNKPADIAQIPGGRFFVATDSENDLIRVIDATIVDRPVAYTLAGNGLVGRPMESGAVFNLKQFRFNSPWGIVVFSGGLVVADAGNHRLEWIHVPKLKIPQN